MEFRYPTWSPSQSVTKTASVSPQSSQPTNTKGSASGQRSTYSYSGNPLAGSGNPISGNPVNYNGGLYRSPQSATPYSGFSQYQNSLWSSIFNSPLLKSLFSQPIQGNSQKQTEFQNTIPSYVSPEAQSSAYNLQQGIGTPYSTIMDKILNPETNTYSFQSGISTPDQQFAQLQNLIDVAINGKKTKNWDQPTLDTLSNSDTTTPSATTSSNNGGTGNGSSGYGYYPQYIPYPQYIMFGDNGWGNSGIDWQKNLINWRF